MIHLRCLGPVELRKDGARVLRGRRKPLALLAYLAFRTAGPAPRRVLADLLWADLDEVRGRQSLRQALSELRGALADGLVAAEAVELRPGVVTTDVEEFARDLERGEPEAALRRWAGEFLAGLDDIGGEAWREWLDGERGRLQRRLVLALDQGSAAAAAGGRWQDARHHADRWREVDPHDPRAWTRSIEIRLDAGWREDAADLFAAAREVLGDARSVAHPDLAGLEARLAKRPDHLDPRSLLTPEFVGREEQLGQLRARWNEVVAGAGHAVGIEGPDRIGKTRFGRELAAVVRAAMPEAIVVEVAPSPEVEGSVGTALRRVLAQVANAPGLSGTAPDRLARLAAASPAVRARYPRLPSAGPPLAGDLGAALASIAAERPVLVIVDDLAAVDPPSRDQLVELAAEPPPRTLVLLTVPPGPDVPRLAIDRLRLGPLEPGAVNRLLSSLGPFAPETLAELATRFRDEGQGNPGAILDQVQLLAETGRLGVSPGGRWVLHAPLGQEPLPVVPPLRERTLARLARLEADTRLLLETAAVLGAPLDPAVLEQATGLPGSRFEAAMADALAERFLRDAIGSPGQFEFSDEAARRTIHDVQAPSRRRTSHRRLARALSRRPGRAALRERIAFHRREGGGYSRAARLTVPIVAVLAIVAANLLPGSPFGRRRALVAGSQVLLTDLGNTSGDSTLGQAIQAAVTIGLQQSRYFSLFPRSRAIEVLGRMRRTGSRLAIDESVGREIAERENLGAVLEVSLGAVDSVFLLTGRVVEPRTGRVLGGARETAAHPEQLIPAVDRLLGHLRRAIGESADSVAAHRQPLPRVTTSSLAALRAYAAGQAAAMRRDHGAAVERWKEALALDSAFAMAAVSTARWYYWNHDRATAERYVALALAHQDRLTTRERRVLDADVARFRGEWRRSVEILRQLAAAYPEPGLWSAIGATLMANNRCDEAIPAFRRVLAVDSTHLTALLNLATCAQFLDRPAEALAAYRQAERVDSSALLTTNINAEVGRALVRLGRLDAADSVFRRRLAQEPPLERASAARSLAYLALHRGRPAEAIEHLRLAINVGRDVATDDLGLLRNQAILADVLLLVGDTVGARAMVDSAVRRAMASRREPIFYFFTGSVAVRAGRVASARRILAALERLRYPLQELDRSAGRLLQATIDLAEGRPRDALAEAAGSVYFDHEAFRLGLAVGSFDRLGVADSARLAADRLAAGFYFGWEAQLEAIRNARRSER